jgi:LuxR family maltose regulon positive regulatory protein
VSAPLLATKLYIPQIRPELVPRRLLLEKLNAAVGSSPLAFARKLTLVSAPAGSGKTTLVSAWLQDLQARGPERAASWLFLDEGDNDPIRFVAYLVAALKKVDGRIGRDVTELLAAAQLPPIEIWAASLINEIAVTGSSFVLVLDDYHAITELAIHEAVEFLLEHLPPQMHLVIVTRQDPALPISRLRARGQVTEIRQDDLRFTHQEAVTFLNGTMGLDLTSSEIAALMERTEGWITGLQMAALALQPMVSPQEPRLIEEGDGARTAEFIASFSGRHHYVLDYLTDEILQRQAEPVQRFLLQTSILDRMCGPLCDTIVGEDIGRSPGGQAMLEMLQKANLFVIPLDDERRWYRYHRLFAELLQARLQQSQAGQVPELHRRAASWYEENGLVPEAVRHILATGDYALAAVVIERAMLKIATWSRLEVATLLEWLTALPEEVVHGRPWLMLFTSRALFSTGRLQDTERVLEELERVLRGDPSLPDAEQVLKLIVADRASYAVVKGDVRQGREFAEELAKLVQKDDDLGQLRALAILGMVYSRSGDVVRAQRMYGQAVELAESTQMPFAAVPFVCNLADVHIIQGQLRQALQTCERAMQMGKAEGKYISATGFACLVRGRILYEQNELAEAERALLDGLKLLSRGGIAESFGNVRAVLAQAKQAQGDSEGASAAIQRAVQLALGSSIPRLVNLTDAYRARIWLAQGKLDLAGQWGHDYRQLAETEYVRDFEDLTLARVLLASERPDDAAVLLTKLLPPAEVAGRMGVVIEGLSLRALALHAQGNTDGALDALASSLALAEPEGYVRVYVDSGEPMRHLLKHASSRGIAPPYVTQLLEAFGTPGPDWTKADRSAQPLVEPLTDRELEVLQHLAEGLSNREIAQRLFVSLPTVKSHARNIYGKLGVNGRKQAVARAKVLGILPSP